MTRGKRKLTSSQEYSPLFLSTTFSLSYGLSFAAIAAVIFHTILFHGQEIVSICLLISMHGFLQELMSYSPVDTRSRNPRNFR